MLQRNLESKLQWPIQGKPDEKSFQIWKQYVSLCFLNHNNHQPTKLGTWDIQENIRTLPQKAYYHQIESEICITNQEGGYSQFEAQDIGQSSACYDPCSTSKEVNILLMEEIHMYTQNQY
jgi:hypothetical protein